MLLPNGAQVSPNPDAMNHAGDRCIARCVIFALAVGVFGPPGVLDAQTTKLDQFVGKALSAGNFPDRELLTLDEVVGDVPRVFGVTPKPWYVWKTTGHGRTRYVIFLGGNLGLVPGGSVACVQLLDATAKIINSWSFSTGWRVDMSSARLEHSDALASDLIVISTEPQFGGPDVATEYFAISKDQLRLVRLESHHGDLAQNDYRASNREIGVAPEADTPEQWIALLESQDKVDVLSALVFLDGKGIDRPALARTARIRELIRRLAKSDDDWVRQAAQLAARLVGLA